MQSVHLSISHLFSPFLTFTSPCLYFHIIPSPPPISFPLHLPCSCDPFFFLNSSPLHPLLLQDCAETEVDRNKCCTLCNMFFTSAIVAQSHYQGKTHAKRVRLVLGEPTNLPTAMTSPTNTGISQLLSVSWSRFDFAIEINLTHSNMQCLSHVCYSTCNCYRTNVRSQQVYSSIGCQRCEQVQVQDLKVKAGQYWSFIVLTTNWYFGDQPFSLSKSIPLLDSNCDACTQSLFSLNTKMINLVVKNTLYIYICSHTPKYPGIHFLQHVSLNWELFLFQSIYFYLKWIYKALVMLQSKCLAWVSEEKMCREMLTCQRPKR